jgi:hypothetical protein
MIYAYPLPRELLTRNAGIQRAFDMTPEQLREDQDPIPPP